MVQYMLSMQNFRGFEVVEIRHTLEIVVQYLQSARAHFEDMQYIDAHLRVQDAMQYATKAELSAELLSPLRSRNSKGKLKHPSEKVK